jgi:hypothetical protein
MASNHGLEEGVRGPGCAISMPKLYMGIFNVPQFCAVREEAEQRRKKKLQAYVRTGNKSGLIIFLKASLFIYSLECQAGAEDHTCDTAVTPSSSVLCSIL